MPPERPALLAPRNRSCCPPGDPQAWQTRLSYAHYLKLKREGEAAGVGSALGGFTRLLDSDRPDGLMEEIPTFLCGPWPEGIPQVSRRWHSAYGLKQD